MEHSKIHSRPEGELDVCYTRRLEDPLEVAFADTDQRQALMDQDKAAIGECLSKGRPGDAAEFITDYSYRSLGIIDRKETVAVAAHGASILRGRLERNEPLTPREKLRLEMRVLDLQNITAFSQFHLASEELDVADLEPKDRKKSKAAALRKLEQQTVSILRSGASLLQAAQQEHDTLSDGEAQQDLRGQMFELLYATYARYEVYQDERVDEEVVVGSTTFDDNAARFFAPENHNYDVLSLDAAGKTIGLVQCKNYANNKRYKWPIQKIEARAFGRFVADPQKCIGAICVLADNNPNVEEQQMVANVKMLEGLFQLEDKTPKAVGRSALVGSST